MWAVASEGEADAGFWWRRGAQPTVPKPKIIGTCEGRAAYLGRLAGIYWFG
jgi:hypothetical protein